MPRHPRHHTRSPHPHQRGRGVIATTSLVLALCATPTPALAQSADAQLTDAQRRRIYERTRIKLPRAMLANAALPGLGNIYAGRIFRGAIFGGVFAMSAFMIFGGITQEDDRFIFTGLGVMGASYAAATVTTYFDVRSYNAALRQRYKLPEEDEGATSLRPLPTPSFGLSWTTRF